MSHYKNVCKGVRFSAEILEKLEGDGYINGQGDFPLQKFRLQREDYYMKKLRTIYPYRLNERAKNPNLHKQKANFFHFCLTLVTDVKSQKNKGANEPAMLDATEKTAYITTFPPKGLTIFIESQKE